FLRPRLAQPRQKFPLETWQSDAGRRSHMEMSMQRALAVVRHEDLRLAFRQVFDLLVFGAEFALLSFRCVRSFFEAFESKELVPNEGLGTACDSMLSRRADEVARRFLVLRAQCDLRVRRRCHILLESLADLKQLREA